MSRLFAGLIALVFACSLPVAAQDGGSKPNQRFYAVIFGVQFAENGDVKTMRLLKVVDPRAGNADAPGVVVPDQYVAAARKLLATPRLRPKPGTVKPDEVFTYFFYDSARPDRADLDPRPNAN